MSENKIIHKLQESVINFIAAGEIVERPASIVKELIENSIDSNSNNIILSIKEKNNEVNLSIEDDGDGISINDIPDLFKKHYTSKAIDLDSIIYINSMGFRGEALWSIGNVSKITLITKKKNEKAVELICKYGDVSSYKEVLTWKEKGTIINIEKIFHNLPARRKFLRNFEVEYGHIVTIFKQEAFCHHNITFHLKNENNIIFNYEKTTNNYNRLMEIMGNNWKFDIENEYEYNNYKCQIILSYKKTGKLFLCVNNRPCTEFKIIRFLKTEIKKQTGGNINYLSGGIWINLPPEDIDLNVHPRKTEIKFKDTNTFYHVLKIAIKNSQWYKDFETNKDNNQYFVSDNINNKNINLKNKMFTPAILLKDTIKDSNKNLIYENIIEKDFTINNIQRNSDISNDQKIYSEKNINADLLDINKNYQNIKLNYQGQMQDLIITVIKNKIFIIKKQELVDILQKENHSNNTHYTPNLFVSKIITLGVSTLEKLISCSLANYPIKFSVLSKDSIIAWEIPNEYKGTVENFFQSLKEYFDGRNNYNIEEFLASVIKNEEKNAGLIDDTFILRYLNSLSETKIQYLLKNNIISILE